MLLRDRQPVRKGSWRWALQVAEATAWGTAGVLLIVFQLADLEPRTYRFGMAATAGLAAWLVVLFRFLLPQLGSRRWLLSGSVVVNLVFACILFGLLRGQVGSIQLIFIPLILATGFLGHMPEALMATVLAVAGYLGTATIVGSPPTTGSFIVTAGAFLSAGLVAGLLARQLRAHYRKELEEHRLATAVRHRLMSVVDAIDEAIVFSDRSGVVRVMNRRAGDLFEIDPGEVLGAPVVQLRRRLARVTEDPEDFMETFQQLHDDPELEIREVFEQIIPMRRRLRLYSGPGHDDAGELVGRVDVFSDVTEAMRRSEELEALYERARKTAESYQRSLLPDAIPSLPRVSMVAHYVPAAGQRAVCGDFYDFVPLPDGRYGVVLGDVCGIGPTAVADAALIRYTLKSFADWEKDAGRLFERINAHLYSQIGSDRFVRLLYGILDPERAVFEYTNAGHVPPIVYRFEKGEVEWLEEGGMAMAVEEETAYKVGRVGLEPGDMLVMYTDGVTEAPRLGQPFGQGRLLDIIRDYGVGTPGELSQAVRRAVEAWVGSDDSRDDLAILVCQVVPDDTIDEPRRELVLPNESVRLGEIRAFASAYLADIRAPVDASSELVLAIGEAIANACRHGRRPDGRSEVRVRMVLDDGVVIATVADDGPGFDVAEARAEKPRDKFAAGGRGLYLMEEFVDEVEYDPTPHGTTVTLRKRLFPSGSTRPRP